jgi:hypothetical protein
MTCSWWQLRCLPHINVLFVCRTTKSCLWDAFAAAAAAWIAGDGPDGAYGMFYTGCGQCPPRHTAMLFYALSRIFDIALVALLICTTLVEMRQRRDEVQQARRDAFAKLGSACKAAAAGGTGAAAAAAQQQRQSDLQPPQMQQMQSPSNSMTAARPAGATSSAAAAAAAAAAAGGSAATSPDSAAHAMWMSGTVGGVADDEDAPLPLVPAARDQQTQQQQQFGGSSGTAMRSGPEIASQQGDQQTQQQQQQQQSATSLTPWGVTQISANSSAGDAAPHAAAGHAVPHSPALHSPTASSLGAFASAQGPLSSISPSSSSGHAALTAHTPAAAAATNPTAGATAGGAGAVIGASSKGHSSSSSSSKSKRPLKRGPLFARELPPAKAAGGHGSRHVVINYSPASLTIGGLFEVGSCLPLLICSVWFSVFLYSFGCRLPVWGRVAFGLRMP